MSSYHSFTVQVRKSVDKPCWICGEMVKHNPYKNRLTFCRITHQKCASFHAKGKYMTDGRMNNNVQYRRYHPELKKYVYEK